MSVVFFHFEFPFFSGGYAGVDVFFVISGYLMHSILSKNNINIKSSLDFYARRIKRIYPALAMCLFIFSIIYTLTAAPSSIESISLQSLSVASFTSNLYFTKALSNYFSGTAGSYLFLNTWSLGVEFQYYLFFPLFLYIVKKSKIKDSSLIITSALISLVICLALVNIKQKIAFFNLPFRAWELLIGAYASSINININIRNKKPIEVCLILSLVLFLVVGGGTDNWPNLKSLIPTVITFFIIIINIGNENSLLKGRVPQSIGLWSYSIYLYHWPIASLLISHGFLVGYKIKVLAVLLSIVLGCLSYLLIEKRKKTIFHNPIFLFSLVLLSVAIPLVVSKSGVYTLWTSNENIRMDSYNKYDTTHQFSISPHSDKKTCFLTSKNPSIRDYDYDYCTRTNKEKKTILLFGDSHIAEFSRAIEEKYSGYNIIQATASGCPPIINSNGVGYCTDLSNLVINKILKEKKIDIAYLSADWYNFSESNDIINGIIKTNKLLKEKIPDVRFLSQTKHYPTRLPTLIIFNKNIGNIKPETGPLLTYSKMKSLPPDVKVIDLYNYGCEKDSCELINKNITPMFFDDNHYTYEWARQIVKEKF